MRRIGNQHHAAVFRRFAVSFVEECTNEQNARHLALSSGGRLQTNARKSGDFRQIVLQIVDQLQRALRAKGYDVVVRNAGVAGDTTQAALRRLDLAIDPDTAICIVEFGVNDLRLRVPRAAMEKRLGILIVTLNRRHIEVLVIGYGGLDLSRLAAQHRALYVPWRVAPGRHRARDGAHYNAEGYRIVVGQMLPAIEILLSRARP